jgi:5-(carboxyamino)imidazole ribonucleotide synthase
VDDAGGIVGVLGAGQLGGMLGLAGIPLGLHFRFLDPAGAAFAGAVGDLRVGSLDDDAAAAALADGAAVVTYEWEGVPAATARAAAARAPVRPDPVALEVAQDRMSEKTLFARLGIAVPTFAAVNDRADLEDALAAVGLPAVLKTRRGGYDGKGQHVLRVDADVDSAWAARRGEPLILEELVAFSRELSVLAVRGLDGATACYPLVETEQRDGVLRVCRAPAPGVTGPLQRAAEDIAGWILDELGYVGVLAVELFERDGALIANELAPRVHNSGHWTIEGAVTSQFENHLRAILGWPLGSTAARGSSGLVNALGSLPPRDAVLAVPGAHLHDYRKDPRPGRKVGHVTVVADSDAERDRQLSVLQAVLDAPRV